MEKEQVYYSVDFYYNGLWLKSPLELLQMYKEMQNFLPTSGYSAHNKLWGENACDFLVPYRTAFS